MIGVGGNANLPVRWVSAAPDGSVPGALGTLAVLLTNGAVYQNTDGATAWSLIALAGAIGDITGVTAGTNMSGGGTSGSVTVNLATSPDIAGKMTIAGVANQDSLTVSGTGAGQTLTDSALIRVNGSGTFDTTAAERFFAAITAVADATRSAGANDLYNTGVYCEASGAQRNTSLYAYQAGVGANDWAITGDGKSRFTSTLLVTGNITAQAELSVASHATVSGVALLSGKLTSAAHQLFTGVISPAALGAADNPDYAPTGFSTTRFLRLTSGGAASTLSGLAGGEAGRIVTLINIAANIITVLAESGLSTAANRFTNGVVLAAAGAAGSTATYWYDGTTARWRQI